jgi:DNA polymerase bacteriophage-type
MPRLRRDIETRSAVDLKVVGAACYAAHPTTGVWCVAYAVDDGPVLIWHPDSEPIPGVFFEAARDPAWTVEAHNDAFETAIETHILAPRYGFPLVPIERHRCTLAQALACALPGKLATVAEVLGLPPKDDEGARLMRQMAKPRKPRKGEDPNGLYWHDEPEKIARLGEYCKRDVEVERAISHRLPQLSDAEQILWVLDAVINMRGIYTDGPLLEAAARIVATTEQQIEREFTAITGLESTGQLAKLTAWLAGRGAGVNDAKKGTLKAALRRKDLDNTARRAIKLRLAAAHDTKVETMLAHRSADGRIRGTLRYHGAGPGRWSAQGVQVQNFVRDAGDVDAKIAAILAGDMSAYPEPLGAVADAARGAIRAAPGRRFLIGDFSGIESRVLAWIAEEKTKLEQWCEFDRTGDSNIEPYFVIGKACGYPDETARMGKYVDLAFGYMGGIKAYQGIAPEGDTSTEQDQERFKQIWRQRHPLTVAFWNATNRAAIKAVRTPDTVQTVKRVTFEYDGDFLKLNLPSKRIVRYPFPRIATNRFGDPAVYFKDTALGGWADCNFKQGAYGGLWTENIVQAISRDLLAEAMQRLEAAGYPIILTVHDEVVAEVPDGFGSLAEFTRLLVAAPAWADGLPIAAKVREGPRFSKPGESKPTAEVDAETDALDDLHDADDANDRDDADEDSGHDDDGEFPDMAEFLRRTGTGPQHVRPDLESASEPEPEPQPGFTWDQIHAAFEQPRDKTYSNGKENGHASGNGRASGNGHDSGYSHNADRYPPHGAQDRDTGYETAFYVYRHADGSPYLGVKRTSTKRFPQFHWTGTAWVKGAPAGPKIPYRLPALIKTPLEDWVLICAGEKDTESAANLGFAATTNPEGERKGAWAPELNCWFAGRQRVVIMEDNDATGQAHVLEVANALRGLVPDIRIVTFRELPKNGDLTDWLEQGHGRDDLLARIEAAPRNGGAILQSVRASQVQMRAIKWLWQDRFALGNLGILAGLPDEGKSMLFNYIAARITGPDRYKWPNDEGEAPRGNVILLTGEDDPEDTVIPRLKAAGAGLDGVEIVNMVRYSDQAGRACERMFSLADDLQLLRRKVEEVGEVRAILIDPVTAYLGKAGTIDSYRDSDVRAVLTPMVHLARELQIAVIAIMHFNKKVDVTNALLRISNSLAFGGVARHVFSVTDDPDNDRKLMARAKNNISAKCNNQTLAFRFETREVGCDFKTGERIRAPAVVFQSGYVDISATEALSAVNENKSPGAKDAAKNWLRTMLTAGPMPKAEVEEAAEAEAITARTLRRAKEDLGVYAFKRAGCWYWALPDKANPQGGAPRGTTP